MVNLSDFVRINLIPRVEVFDFEEINKLSDEEFIQVNEEIVERYVDKTRKKNNLSGGNPLCFDCKKEINNYKKSVYAVGNFYHFTCLGKVYTRIKISQLRYQEHLREFYERILKLSNEKSL